MVSLEILKSFCGAFGPSSAECEIRSLIKETLKDHCEFITTAHGNLIAYNPRSKGERTIMFQAHMDELCFRPYRYRPDGFIELSPVSPIPHDASNQMILFHPTKVTGILEIEKRDQQMRYFLDVGAHSKEEALSMVPSYSNGAYWSPFQETPNFLCSKSFDDRAGCAVIAHTLMEARNNGNRIIGAFTTREESGNWPIPELRYALKENGLLPDLVINLEVCPGGPTPRDVQPMAILGKGITLVHMDRYYISDPRICQAILELAVAKNIAHQDLSERDGGGELGSICNELGVNGYSMVIPGRYMHSPHSVISRNDYEAAIAMAIAIAEDGTIVRSVLSEK